MKIEQVAICGMGALGMLYGRYIMEHDGAEDVSADLVIVAVKYTGLFDALDIFPYAVEPDSEAHRMMVAAMREAMAVARCEGIPIEEKNLNEYVRMLDTLAPDAVPSMRQDGLARRRSEVEIFAGTVRMLAKKHHILVPANEFLYKRVTEIEESYIRTYRKCNLKTKRHQL